MILTRPISLTIAIVALGVSLVRADEKPGAPLQAGSATVRSDIEIRYWLYLPDGYETSPEEKFPLILFLHGGGESGDDLELVKKHGIPKELINGRKLPCIVLAPQNPYRDGLWDDRALYAFLEDRLKELRVDESRIYLAGMSRGGHGVYRLAVQHPRRFAAVVMVCGGGPISYAKWAKDTPFWFFHGDSDPVVPTEESRRLSAAIRDAGGEAKLTIYPDTQHDSWSQAFADDALYQWLFSKHLSAEPNPQ